MTNEQFRYFAVNNQIQPSEFVTSIYEQNCLKSCGFVPQILVGNLAANQSPLLKIDSLQPEDDPFISSVNQRSSFLPTPNNSSDNIFFANTDVESWQFNSIDVDTQLRPTIDLASQKISAFFQRPNWTEQFALAFGSSFDPRLIQTYSQQLPNIRIVKDLGGANGAFSAKNNTIYLSHSLVEQGDQQKTVAVVIEEIGHGIDAYLNQQDSPGDEGEIFAQLVAGNLDQRNYPILLAENDHATHLIDGQWLEIEQSSLAGTPEVQLASQLGDVLLVPGNSNESVKLSFQWTERDAAFNNEIGVFVIDDQGRVDGIDPSDPKYAQAAIGSATRQVIFATGRQAGDWNELSFQGGSRLGFYLIQNNSTENWLAINPNNRVDGQPIAFFSVNGSNPDGFDHVNSESLGKGNWRLRWEDITGGGDRDFNDVVFTVSQPGILIPGNQGQQAPIKVDLVSREASYRNELGYYLVDDAEGRIGKLLPGDVGYAQAALAAGRYQTVFSGGQEGSNQHNLPSGQYVGWYLVSNGSTTDLLRNNPRNLLSNDPVAFFSYNAANPDGLSHLHQRTTREWGWEDVVGAGDRDFNDLVFSFELGLPINQPPTALTLSQNLIAENTPKNLLIGTFSSQDPDAGDGHTYTLIAGTGDTDNSSFAIVNNELRINSSPDFEAKPTYSLRVKTTDRGGLSTEQTFSINITNVNEPPTVLTLSQNLIAENSTANSLIGTFGSQDPDAGDRHSYTLIAGTGDTDNSSFAIVNNELRINNSPDFEAKPTYNLWVKTTDRGGLSAEQTFSINITNVNEPPTVLTLSQNSIAENSAANSLIGIFGSQDPDAGDGHSYTLIAGIGDTDNSSFSIINNELRINSSPDFEAKPTYSLRVKTTDRGGLSTEQTFSINITNVNEPPTVLTLSQNSIAENSAANSLIGTFGSQDPDVGDGHSYILIAGTGDTDNSSFSIVNNELRINSSLDFEAKPIYSLRIRTTDRGGLGFDQIFSVSITDLDEVLPSIKAVLANDTGASKSDRLTLDPTISGQTTRATALLGNLNGNGFVDISSALNNNDGFTISLDQYSLLNKGSLPNGEYNLVLKAKSSSGQESEVATVSFTLDRTPPPLNFGLTPESDTGILGDGTTTKRNVTLLGQTDPGLQLALLGNQRITAADNTGKFTFDNTLIPTAGKAPFTIVATDVAGNQSQVINFLTREGINGAPVITSNPITVFNSSQQTIYTYQIVANDPDSDTLTYNLLTAPEGTEVDKNGLIRFTPSNILQPSYDFNIEVNDGRGGKDAQAFTLKLPDVSNPFGTIRGTKWEDLNGNGSRDIVNFDNFSSNISSLKVNSSAAILPSEITGRGDVIRLTASQNDQAGNALLQNPFDIVGTNGKALSFSTNFTFSITDSKVFGDEDGAGADGLAFIISPTQVIGSNGGGIGYGGLNNSVAIELDTYNNGENDNYNGNHIGININGNLTSVAQNNVPNRFNDGSIWHVWIDYEGSTQTLEARVSQDTNRPTQATVSSTVNISQVLGQENIFVGFTSGTGAGVGNHDIVSWAFQTNEPGLPGVSVYLDSNNNGLLDTGEPVQITTEDNPNTLSINESGQYEFTNLKAGDYIVREIIPSGFVQTFPGREQETTTINFDNLTPGITPGNILENKGVTFSTVTIPDTIIVGDNITIQPLSSDFQVFHYIGSSSLPNILVATGSNTRDSLISFSKPVSSVSLTSDNTVEGRDIIRLIALSPTEKPNEFKVLAFDEAFDDATSAPDNLLSVDLGTTSFSYAVFQVTTELEGFDDLIFKTAPLSSSSAKVTVLGTNDPWLSGLPEGSVASNGDTAPEQSPTSVSELPIIAGSTLTFNVTGSVNNDPFPSGLTPDGGVFISHSNLAENGISNITAPINSLVGVFLGDENPSLTPAPNEINFQNDYTTFTPELKQVFFIGDGRNNDGKIQTIVVPQKAARLFLGTMDGFGWANNFGSFDVSITSSPLNRGGYYNVNLEAGKVVENLDFGNTQIIDPTNSNSIPVITSSSPNNIIIDNKYTYQVVAIDLDRDILKYRINNSPAGLTIDDNGLITWTPTSLGTFTAEIQVDDSKGGIATQKIDLVVLSTLVDKEAPQIKIGSNGSVFKQGETLTLQVQGLDNFGLADTNLSFNGNPLALRPNIITNGYINNASVTLNTVGIFEVLATARDTSGNVGTKTLQIRVIDPNDTEAPDVQFDLSQFDSLKPITDVTNIVGTIKGEGLEFYRVDIAPVSLIDLSNPGGSDSDYITIAQSNSTVDNGILAKIDPRLYRNDSYYVRIVAQDYSGNINVQGAILGISSQNKPGEFRLEYTDLTVPLTGIPIEVRRVYNSLNSQLSGDFGYGWNLALQNAQIQEASPDGRDLSGDNFFGGTAFTVGTRVNLTTPDGRRVGFTFNPTLTGGSFFGPIYKPAFTPDAGVYDTLEVVDTSLSVKKDGSVGLFLVGLGFNPSEYSLKTRDGITYRYDQFKGLIDVTDGNNNKLTYTDTGISSSTGQSITFKRDAQNRITEIVDPTGKVVKYSYDAKGDLAGVIDRTDSTTQFKYKNTRSHYVTEVVDPLGRSARRTEYDAQGRIARIIDADGLALDLNYTDGASSQTVKDPLGNTITRIFDAKGNVVQEVDALGGIIKRTYDANNNVASVVNPEGRSTSYSYDSKGNKLSETDGEGNTKRYTYNQSSKVLTETDAIGNVTTYVYDASNNLTSRKDALGNTITYTYGQFGLLTEVVDANKQKSTFSYDQRGNLLELTDPTGAKTKFAYDSNGRVLSTTDALGAVTINTYDAQGRLIGKEDAAGTTKIEFNAAGEKVADIDALGHRTEYRYNKRGLLLETILADETPADLGDNPRTKSEYDALDRVVATVDELGRKTQYIYDKLGRQIEVIYPDVTPNDLTDNPRTKQEYDKAGLVIAEIDELGNRTELKYDQANRLVSRTNALKEVITYTYDASSRQISVVDPLGRKTSYDYDGLSRVISTTYANNAIAKTAYDPLGRIVAQTDLAGNTTKSEYDALGRLTAVVDALNQRTEYKYDAVGNLIEQKDANNHVNKFEYDSLGRRKAAILPGGQRNETVYNAIGNIIRTTDFNGATTTFEYDARNRLIKNTFSDGTPTESFTYTLNGKLATVTDNRGVTSYVYDERDRLLSRTEPDTRRIQYTYDAAGNIRSLIVPSGTTSYTYDALNRIDTVIAPDLGKTDYTYDKVGNLIKTDFANGVTTTKQYDLLNRLTNLENRNQTGIISSYTYTLDEIGNRIKVVEHDGRIVEYTYDPLNRLTQEKITDPVVGNKVIDYKLDPVSNRLERTDSVLGKTTYSYDVNDRLLEEVLGGKVTQYQYDAKGNLTAKVENGQVKAAYKWNAKGELAAVEVTENGVTESIEFEYDHQGIRVAIKQNGEETRFLIDNNQQQYAQVIEEYQANGVTKAAYVHGWDLISQTNSSGTNYYQVDGLGSTRQLTNSTGTIRVEYDYDAYGNLTNKVGDASNNYLFAGEQFNASVDGYYLRARYYNPATGRFASTDSFEGYNEEPITLPDYLYAGANPIIYTDPSGDIISVETQLLLAVTYAFLRQRAVQFLYFTAIPAAKEGKKLYDGYKKFDQIFDYIAEIIRYLL